jgi:ribosomal protein S17E
VNAFIPQIAGYVTRTTPEVAHFASSFYGDRETAEEFSVKRFVLQLVCIVSSIRIRNLVVTFPN